MDIILEMGMTLGMGMGDGEERDVHKGGVCGHKCVELKA